MMDGVRVPDDPSHTQIMAAIAEVRSDVGHLDRRVERMEGRLNDKIDRLDARLVKVEVVAQFGRGVGWATLRWGGAIVAAIAAWEWLREKWWVG